MKQKSLLTRISEAIDQHRIEQAELRRENSEYIQTSYRRQWLPVVVNTLLVLLLIGAFWAQSVGAISLGAASASTSTNTIAYQGRLADADGNPLTETANMVFRLYTAAEGGAPLWEEQWTTSNGVQVSDGLFNVMLGSLTPIPQAVVTGNDPLFLGISVGTDGEMAPRVQLGSVPFAVQALTVPDNSITTEKIEDGVITSRKLQPTVGMARVVSDEMVFLGPASTRYTISESATNVTVDVPSRLLIRYDSTFGATHFEGLCGFNMMLVVDGQDEFVSATSGAPAWYTHSGNVVLDVPAGTHDLSLDFSASCDAPRIHWMPNRTSLSYLVVSQ